MNTLEMEINLMRHFNSRLNIIVPNISWGFLDHEADLFVVTPAGVATEIEIKVSLADLRKDLIKKHGHYSERIKKLYFAVPEKLRKNIALIPARAGVLIVHDNGRIETVRQPVINKAAKNLTEKDRLKIAALGTMRILGFKEKIHKLNIGGATCRF